MSDQPDTHDWQKDGLGNFTLAVLAMREIGVREGIYPPVDDTERRQAKEGPVRPLDCVKESADAR